MLCPNCGNPTSRKHTCEHCGYVFARKNSNHSFRNTLLLVLLMLFIAVFLWAASLNYLNFHGYSTEKISSNGYPSPASLLNDYMKYAKEGKPRFVLSTFHPEIIRYYSDYYSKNEQIHNKPPMLIPDLYFGKFTQQLLKIRSRSSIIMKWLKITVAGIC